MIIDGIQKMSADCTEFFIFPEPLFNGFLIPIFNLFIIKDEKMLLNLLGTGFLMKNCIHKDRRIVNLSLPHRKEIILREKG